MQLKTNWIEKTGGHVAAVWEDCAELPATIRENAETVRGFCFYDGKFVIINDDHGWQTPAGHIETGETVEVALAREVQEESNMKVLRFWLLGYLYSENDHIQKYEIRCACEVEPFGPFTSDPDGDVTEMKLIDIADYKKYFDWGDVGEYTIQRAKAVFDGKED